MKKANIAARKELKRLRKEARKDSSAKCKGECCAQFTLGMNYIERANELVAFNPKRYKETAQIADMVVFIKPDPIYEGSGHYTCKFFDPETKRCGNYVNRPRMCSEYPYDGICGICGVVGTQVKNMKKAKLVFCCSDHEKEYSK